MSLLTNNDNNNNNDKIMKTGYMSYLEHFIPYYFGLNFVFYAAAAAS